MALNERRVGSAPPSPALGVGRLVHDCDHSVLVHLDLYFAGSIRPLVMAPYHVVPRAANVHAVLVVHAVPSGTGELPYALRMFRGSEGNKLS